MVFSFDYTQDQGIGHYLLKGNLIGESYGMTLLNSFAEQMELGMLNFAVDLSQLEHINSSGLGVLITMLTKARKKDGELVLVSPSQNVRNLLLITKLNSIFQTFDGLDAAVEKIKTT